MDFSGGVSIVAYLLYRRECILKKESNCGIMKRPRKGCRDVFNAYMCQGAVFGSNDIPLCPTTATALPEEVITWEEAKSIYKAMSKGISYLYFGTKGHIVSVASYLPSNPTELLNNGWEDISHPSAADSGHYELKETTTGLRIRFDKKISGASGFRGKDHYHILNPNATGNHNLYLDKDGNPVRKSSTASHILPQ